MTLDEVEQLFLGFEVVIQPCQRHSARPGKITHGCAFVSLLVENVGRVGKDFTQTLVKTALQPVMLRAARGGPLAGSGCWKARHKIERSFEYRVILSLM